MDTEQTTEGAANTANGEGEGNEQSSEAEVISVAKKDYDTLNQTLGSLKRELKDLKKAGETTKETPQTKPENNGLIQKTFLRAAGITDAEEVDLALTTAKKWGVEVDSIVDDVDFQAKLERHRTNKQNLAAATNVRGGSTPNQAKNDPAYWIAKGAPPSREDVPDRKTRAVIARAFIKNASTDGKVFYND